MITIPGEPTGDSFALRRLPWGIAGAGLLLYLLTLNPWFTLDNLTTLTRPSLWPNQTDLEHPLRWLVFLPFQVLPKTWLPIGVNIFTALIAALGLSQLARSVAILRQDVPTNDPMRRKTPVLVLLGGSLAWLPPAFAAMVCGLQLGFWKHATAASGEMLSLLCFAYALRCVMEFRWQPQQKWLSQAAFGYALGMTDNWLLLGYLPVFVAGIIWVKGFSPFLEVRFLARLFGWALAGLSLLLVVPLLLAWSDSGDWTIGMALKNQWSIQRNALGSLRSPALRLFALTGLLPFLILAVRWRSHTVQLADDTHQGVFVTKVSGHFIHALFLLTSMWIAFNPTFIPIESKFRTPLLIYYYAWAVAAGYGLGYLLTFAAPRSSRPPPQWPVYATGFLVASMPVMLVWANYPNVRLTNSNALLQLARQVREDLPAGAVAALSDDSLPLLLLNAELQALPRPSRPLLVHTRLLPAIKYHHQMRAEYGTNWPEPNAGTNTLLTANQVRDFVARLGTNQTLVYVHPSSGFFLEDYSATPRGWVQILLPRDTAAATEPPQFTDSAPSIWEQRAPELDAWAREFARERNHEQRQALLRKSLRLAQHTNELASALSPIYSKALNHWGVTSQRMGATNAAIWFDRALAFDAANLPAFINLAFARRNSSGEAERLTLAWLRANLPALPPAVGSWPEMINRYGPVDEPTFLLRSGRMYLAALNPHQAQSEFARAVVLNPNWTAPRLWLAQSHLMLQDFGRALGLTDTLLAPQIELRPAALAQLLQIRTAALRRLGQTNEANSFITSFTTQHQNQTNVLGVAAELCSNMGQYEDELKWRTAFLALQPDHIDMLVKKGLVEVRLKQFAAATKTLTIALNAAPHQDEARLFRAIAEMQAGQLDAAQQDYRALLDSPALAQSARFGLGGIAWRQGNTNALKQYYEAFLTNGPPDLPQTELVEQRLKDWQDE